MPVDDRYALVAVRPFTLFTEPIAKPLFSTKSTVPVFAANVVMAFEVLVRVYVPPVPASSRLVAASACDCVTVPVDDRYALVAVRPLTLFTEPIAKPLFSTKFTVPVLAASVVMAFEVLVRV